MSYTEDTEDKEEVKGQCGYVYDDGPCTMETEPNSDFCFLHSVYSVRDSARDSVRDNTRDITKNNVENDAKDTHLPPFIEVIETLYHQNKTVCSN